jgi:hypothetical protein
VSVRHEDALETGGYGYFDSDSLEVAIARQYVGDEGQSDQDVTTRSPLQRDKLAELATLAHEYGHVRSYRNDPMAWQGFLDALARKRRIINELAGVVGEKLHGLSVHERQQRITMALYQGLGKDARARILEEEAKAWATGRQVLAEFGVTDFTHYDERTDSGLRRARSGLGIELPS